MKDARSRAERLAKSQGKKLGEPYSISEFMTRGEERYMLVVSRRIRGQSSAEIAALSASGYGGIREPFEPGIMVANAQVFVVFLLR